MRCQSGRSGSALSCWRRGRRAGSRTQNGCESGSTAAREQGEAEIGERAGYGPLAVEIVMFFRTREIPVSELETLEIYAFMEAADESERQGGAEVRLDAYMAQAREEARRRLEELDRP